MKKIFTTLFKKCLVIQMVGIMPLSAHADDSTSTMSLPPPNIMKHVISSPSLNPTSPGGIGDYSYYPKCCTGAQCPVCTPDYVDATKCPNTCTVTRNPEEIDPGFYTSADLKKPPFNISSGTVTQAVCPAGYITGAIYNMQNEILTATDKTVFYPQANDIVDPSMSNNPPYGYKYLLSRGFTCKPVAKTTGAWGYMKYEFGDNNGNIYTVNEWGGVTTNCLSSINPPISSYLKHNSTTYAYDPDPTMFMKGSGNINTNALLSNPGGSLIKSGSWSSGTVSPTPPSGVLNNVVQLGNVTSTACNTGSGFSYNYLVYYVVPLACTGGNGYQTTGYKVPVSLVCNRLYFGK